MAEMIKRYRGDNYPVEVTLTRDGDWTLNGSTVKMSFRFDETTYTFTGTITDATEKIVEFQPTTESVSQVRRGTYDIQVDDGTHITTHGTGEIRISDDVT